MTANCISYERSIDKLRLPRCGSFGVVANTESDCNVVWDLRQRQNWWDALGMAQKQIESDLAAPLCAQEICDEIHRPRCPIQLKFRPIAYLGQRVYSDWIESSIDYTGTHPNIVGEADLCPGYDLLSDNLDFAYPEIECYEGQPPLQTPCITEIVCGGGGGGNAGVNVTWPACQLILPSLDSATLPGTAAEVAGTGQFLTSFRYRTWEIDEDLAYEVVGECACAVCATSNPTYALTVGDAQLGTVCVEGVNTCPNSGRRIKINYATSYNCGLTMDLNLEWAVILLALTKMYGNKLCGCDKFNFVSDYWLEFDPSAGGPLVMPSKLLYGNTRAGLEVARIVANTMRRMHFTAASGVGGLLTTFSGRRSFRGRVVA